MVEFRTGAGGFGHRFRLPEFLRREWEKHGLLRWWQSALDARHADPSISGTEEASALRTRWAPADAIRRS
jgi:hypothetical protein